MNLSAVDPSTPEAGPVSHILPDYTRPGRNSDGILTMQHGFLPVSDWIKVLRRTTVFGKLLILLGLHNYVCQCALWVIRSSVIQGGIHTLRRGHKINICMNL
jgi:hypothetical protein